MAATFPNITIQNDGKGQSQSFTAETELFSSNADAHVQMYATAYGESEAHAKANLSRILQNLTIHLSTR